MNLYVNEKNKNHNKSAQRSFEACLTLRASQAAIICKKQLNKNDD